MSAHGGHDQTAGRPSLRLATTSDAERLCRAVTEGLELYKSFAPEGWRVPAREREIERLEMLLRDPDVWCLLAEEDAQLVGQVTVLPAGRSARPVHDAALAHLANLFVRRDFWGTGLAGALHAAAVEAARRRGYSRMRLFVAAGHRRARRFYEREGWTPVGAEFHDPGPGLVLVEYRYELIDPEPS